MEKRGTKRKEGFQTSHWLGCHCSRPLCRTPSTHMWSSRLGPGGTLRGPGLSIQAGQVHHAPSKTISRPANGLDGAQGIRGETVRPWTSPAWSNQGMLPVGEGPGVSQQERRHAGTFGRPHNGPLCPPGERRNPRLAVLDLAFWQWPQRQLGPKRR